MAPKQLRHVDAGADLALRQQLAEIKRVPLEQVGRIRMTPEKMPSLVDVGVALTGKAARHVADDLTAIMHKHPEVSEKVGHFRFGGQGQRSTPIPKDLAALVEIIFLLPGRAAAQVRQAAAQIFVRYLGGDLSLVREVEHLHHVQTFLRENAPEHPLRAFGEAVEAECPDLAAKRKAVALLELEVRENELKARVEASKAQVEASKAQVEASKAQVEQAHGETKKARVDTFVYCHEAARRLGVEPDDRTRLQLRDLVQSVAFPAEALPKKELCARAFLLSKKGDVGLEISFGRLVAALKREHLRGAGLSEELPTKTIYANGQAVQAKLYFEEDRPFFETAWERIGGAHQVARRERRVRPYSATRGGQ